MSNPDGSVNIFESYQDKFPKHKKTCSFCAHYTYAIMQGSNGPVCLHPDNISGRSLVNNALEPRYACGTLRKSILDCGPEGKWFKPTSLHSYSIRKPLSQTTIEDLI